MRGLWLIPTAITVLAVAWIIATADSVAFAIGVPWIITAWLGYAVFLLGRFFWKLMISG